MSTVKIRSLTTTATTTASDDFLVIDGTTNSTRKLSAATPAFLTSVTVPTVATAAGVNLNLATGTAASDKVLIPGTLEATAADGLAASIGTLGGASVKKALWVGGIINVAGHTTFEGVTSTGATGTGKLVYDTSPSLTTPALGTPSALVGTNITGTAAGLTAGNVTTNANLTGDVTSVGNATSIAAGVIVNADINASAAIVDTKLDTIATALKVSNSATTAASANTASAIVARDASGNFSAGTVSAALTGNASTATALATGRTIAITGDLAYTSPSFDGSGNVTAAGTLATVASAGTTGGSTAIPVVTINAKGLTTSITTAAVIAPAGTLSGSTLASGVTASSLTSLGTIANLAVTAGTISGTPSASTDIANKLYVDTVAQGLDAKASCIAATTANITLSGTQTIDGISVIAADRVLVKNQTLSQNNGIYLCASGAWTRTTDADTWDELTSAFVFIETGTVNADTGWVCTANAGGTLGTTALPWSQFSGAGSYTASTGLTLTGTAFSLTAPVTVALGGTNATSAGIAAFNNISGFTAAGATGTTSTNLVFSTSPTITSPTITGGALNGTLGATTPSTVAGTTGTFTTTSGSPILSVISSDSNGDVTAQIKSTGSTGSSQLIFSDTAAQSGKLLYRHADDSLAVETGGAERARFTSTGLNSTAIGATTPSTGAFTTLSASATSNTPITMVTTNAISQLSLDTTAGGATDATQISFRRNGTAKWTVGNNVVNTGDAFTIASGGVSYASVTSTGLNSTAIGATTPSTGAFSTLSASGITTLTAALNTNSIITVTANNIRAFVGTTGAGTGFAYGTYETNGGAQYGRVGIEGSSGGVLLSGTGAYDFIVGSISGNTWIGAGGTGIAKVSGTGLAVTGAVTTTGNLKSSNAAGGSLELNGTNGNSQPYIYFERSGSGVWTMGLSSDASANFIIGNGYGGGNCILIAPSGAITTSNALTTTGSVTMGGWPTIGNDGNATYILQSAAAITSYTAGTSVGTLTNAPAAGNPTKWMTINDNGTLRRIPTW